MRLRNGTGATALAAQATCAARWRHGRAGEFYESNVYKLIVIARPCAFLRAPQAPGVTGRVSR